MATLTSIITKFEYSVEKPLNREPPVEQLVSSFITKDGGFDRNHGPIPHIDPSTHTLNITDATSSPTHQPLSLSLTPHDLRTRFPQHTLLAALQCAGNRRHTMRTQLREVKGVDWLDGAAMCCIWRGPLLRDVLLAAGVRPARSPCLSLERVDSVVDGRGGDADRRGGDEADAYAGLHVHFESHATACQEAGHYAASIPLSRAMGVADEVVLAVEMNGRALTAAHGAPVRVVVPGCAGARCVKWLDTITVHPHESPNHYQRRDYKLLPPTCLDGAAAEKWWALLPPLMDMPVNSVIGIPASASRVTASSTDGTIEVAGYALPGGRNGPVRWVEVSGDEGRTWTDAEILGPPKDVEEMGLSLKWAWSLWRARVRVEKGSGRKVWSRATDGRDRQPRYPEWNWRGLAYNGYGEVSGLVVE